MCINRTFSELDGREIANEYYSIRYVMENDAPRFVLTDIVKALGYKAIGTTTNQFCRKFFLGKVVGADNKLRTYATKEQVDLILDHSYYSTSEFRDFWNNTVVPATDKKYAGLKNQVDKEKEENRRLTEVYESLKKENEGLEEKIAELQNQKRKISAILGLSA